MYVYIRPWRFKAKRRKNCFPSSKVEHQLMLFQSLFRAPQSSNKAHQTSLKNNVGGIRHHLIPSGCPRGRSGVGKYSQCSSGGLRRCKMLLLQGIIAANHFTLADTLDLIIMSPQGYVSRQALYACGTCTNETSMLPAGVCLACSLHCHEGHELYELYTKRLFRCDCGNEKFPGFVCTLNPVRT